MANIVSGIDGRFVTESADIFEPKTSCPRGFFVFWVECPGDMTLITNTSRFIDPHLDRWLTSEDPDPDYMVAMPTAHIYSSNSTLTLPLEIACVSPQPVATATPTVTPTWTAVPPVEISFSQALYCRYGPDVSWGVAVTIPAGYSTEVLGQAGPNQSWFMINLPDGSGQCWLPRDKVTVTTGDPYYLLIYIDPPTPTAKPVYIAPQPTAGGSSSGSVPDYCECVDPNGAPYAMCYPCASTCGGVGPACTP